MAKNIKVKGDPNHLETIKTMGISVKLFEDAFNLFMSTGLGDDYKDMETKRNNMFLKCSVAYNLACPMDNSSNDAKALEIGRQALAFQETQEKQKGL